MILWIWWQIILVCSELKEADGHVMSHISKCNIDFITCNAVSQTFWIMAKRSGNNRTLSQPVSHLLHSHDKWYWRVTWTYQTDWPWAALWGHGSPVSDMGIKAQSFMCTGTHRPFTHWKRAGTYLLWPYHSSLSPPRWPWGSPVP